jgi:hypothetical protein
MITVNLDLGSMPLGDFLEPEAIEIRTNGGDANLAIGGEIGTAEARPTWALETPAPEAVPSVVASERYTVRWSAVEGAIAYELQMAVAHLATKRFYPLYRCPDLLCCMNNAALGTYRFRVRALGGGTQSEWSSEELIEVQQPSIPAPPVLHPIGNPQGRFEYIVRCSAVEGAENYELQERWPGKQGFGKVHGRPAYETGHEVHITFATAGVHGYRVRAGNSQGFGEFSNIVETEVGGAPEPRVSSQAPRVDSRPESRGAAAKRAPGPTPSDPRTDHRPAAATDELARTKPDEATSPVITLELLKDERFPDRYTLHWSGARKFPSYYVLESRDPDLRNPRGKTVWGEEVIPQGTEPGLCYYQVCARDKQGLIQWSQCSNVLKVDVPVRLPVFSKPRASHTGGEFKVQLS